ncbi:DUF3224 domain-containing protein [Herbidospora daliensis]|uniref:DUF3224 domain-containing protein n=1 Tax=Herbidospora daliensis TaxID=295585 RepID=UPI0007810F25|nr:DUF3224 domain-containing protein [Herbidospora daliensis]
MHATGTFDITTWDTLATDEHPGATIARHRLTKHFTGDLTGTSTTEILTVATPDGPAAYTGLEHVDATLHGRKGTFVLAHSAGGGADGTPWMRWEIVATSGTGELTGITGSGQIINDDGHHYTLDYTLGT